MAATTGSQTAAASSQGTRFEGLRVFLRRFMRQPLGVVGFLVLAALVIIAIIGPDIAPHDPYTLGTKRLAPPSAEHLAGTDQLGRDVWSRIMYGVRPAIVVALGAVLVSVVSGATIGMVSAYLGGVFDLVAQRVMDALDALPSLFLGILVLTIVKPSYGSLVFAIGLVMLPITQRVVRASTLSVKTSDFVTASRVLGATDSRLILRHILPNILSPILVLASAELGGAILTASSLAFLGFGTPPPEPSLGAMVSGEGRQFMTQAPWLVVAPAAMISLSILSANFIGDALRDVLDPRLRT
ncbi:MAG: ABC transporter permease [Chloroflexi bacterium]|nr:ABC transporter permease [Chloroflexota bacterium]